MVGSKGAPIHDGPCDRWVSCHEIGEAIRRWFPESVAILNAEQANRHAARLGMQSVVGWDGSPAYSEADARILVEMWRGQQAVADEREAARLAKAAEADRGRRAFPAIKNSDGSVIGDPLFGPGESQPDWAGSIREDVY